MKSNTNQFLTTLPIASSLLPLSGNLPESCQPDDEDESGLRAVRTYAPASLLLLFLEFVVSCAHGPRPQAHVAAARSKLPMLTQLKQMYALFLLLQPSSSTSAFPSFFASASSHPAPHSVTRRGCDLDATDFKGRTPLAIACMAGTAPPPPPPTPRSLSSITSSHHSSLFKGLVQVVRHLLLCGAAASDAVSCLRCEAAASVVKR